MQTIRKVSGNCLTRYLSNRPLRIAVFFVLLFRWLTGLKSTDAYFSAYIVCAVAGAVAFISNTATERQALRSKRDHVYTGLFSVLFSLSVLLSNYSLFTPPDTHLSRVLIMFIGGYIIARNILVCVLNRSAAHEPFRPEDRETGVRKVFLITFACIAAADLLYLFFCYFPGIISADSVAQIDQTLSGNYTNHHPFWHTMIINLCLKTGILLFNDINSACAFYCVFQVVCMAAVFAFLVMTMYQAGIRRGWLIATVLGYMLLPYHVLFSISMWKDILFGGAVALFGCSLYRMIRGIGSKITNYIALVIGTIGFGLLRSNGWTALAVTFVLSVFILGKKHRKVLLTILGLLVMTFILKYPVLKWLNVSQPDTVEYLSIPEQQIARVIVEDAELTPDEQEQIEKIMPIEEVQDYYEPQISDPIKYVLRGHNPDYLSEHKLDYLKLWLQLGIRYPELYADAWIDQTRGYWNAGYNYYVVETSVYYNENGIEETRNGGFPADALTSWVDTFLDDPLFEPVRSIGLHVWIVILALFVMTIERRKARVIPISLLAIILTLLISTPVFSEFRYAYSTFATFPFVVLIAFADRSDNAGLTAEEAG